jgi:hypothetical protein
MSITIEAKTAIAKFAARFVFDDEIAVAQQEDLARCIEVAIDDFKSTQLQPLIARTVRAALEKRIHDAIAGWRRQYDYPQPVQPPTDSAA